MFFLKDSIGCNQAKRIGTIILSCLTLTACGGGSSSQNNDSKQIANKAPTVVVSGDNKILEQTQFKLLGTAQDDGGIIHYQWQHNSHLELDISDYNSPDLKVISPDIAEPHRVTFTLTVKDDKGSSASAQHALTLLPVPTINITGIESVSESEPFSLTSEIAEQSVEVASYQWRHDSKLPLQLKDENTPTLSVISADIETEENVNFTVLVVDTSDNTFEKSHMVRIEPLINLAPEIEISGPSDAQGLSQLQLIASVTDPEGSDVAVSWQHDSDLEFNMSGEETAKLTISIPDIETRTTVTFTASASDEQGQSTFKTHTISLTPKPNEAPAVHILAPSSVEEGQIISLEAKATDSDGSIVGYKWRNDGGLDLSPTEVQARSIAILTPDILEDKQVNFTVTVTDDDGAEATITKAVTIIAKSNLAPVVKVVGPTSIGEEMAFTLSSQSEDLDGSIVSHRWSYESPVSINVGDTGSEELHVSGISVDEGIDIKFFVTVTDNQGAVTTKEHQITVIPLPNVPPEVTISASNTAFEERTRFTLTANATDVDGQIETYYWQHDSALELILAGENSDSLTVEVPDITEDQTITFTVVVTDHQGALAGSAFTAKVAHLRTSTTLKGKVTDSPIANANVQLKVGEHVFQTIADANGNYEIGIDLDESQKNLLIELSAQGVGSQKDVALVSQLGEVAGLVEAAGEDNTVDSKEYFGINITNVTTAEYALLKEGTPAFTSEAELTEARAHVDVEEKLEVAALLKAIIDHGHELPDGINSTLELANNLREARKMLKKLKKSEPELVARLRAEIKADKDLMNEGAEPLLGTYFIGERTLMNGFVAALSFNEDRTGQLTAKQNVSFTWERDGSKIELRLAEPLPLYGTGEFKSPTDYVSTITIDVYENSKGRFSGDISMFSDGKSQTVKAFHSGLISQDSKPEQQAEDFIGQWSIAYQDKFGNKNSYAIEFLDNGEADISSYINPMQIPWGIKNHEMFFNKHGDDVTAKFVRNLPIGKLIYLEDMYLNKRSLLSALLIKHQNVSFDDIDYQRTWTPIEQKGRTAAFEIDENNQINYFFKHAEAVEKVDGKLLRHIYTLDRTEVDFCDVSLPNCEILFTHQLKLLATYEDKIAVEFSQIGNASFGGFTFSNVMLFELSDEALTHSDIHAAFTKTDRYQYAFDGRAELFAQTETDVVNLSRFTHCTGSVPRKVCQEAVSINGEDYFLFALSDRIQLTHIANGRVSYLQFIDVNDNGFSICHFIESAECTAANTLHYSPTRPALNINLEQEGLGQLISSKNTYSYGESFTIEASPDDGYELKSIEGCDGKLQTTSDLRHIFSVNAPKHDCAIKAVFVPSPPYVGDVVFVNTRSEIPHSWRLSFGNIHHGMLYTHDSFTATDMTKISEGLYRARFKGGTARISTNGIDVFKAIGFDLKTTDQGHQIIWRAVNEIDNEEYDLDPIQVANKSELPTVPVTAEDMQGTWLLTHHALDNESLVHSGQNYKLTLSQDHQGSMSLITLNPEIAQSQADPDLIISWRINSFGHLEVFHDEYDFFVEFKMTEARNDGFNLVTEKVHISASNTDLKNVKPFLGAGALVKIQDSTFKIDNLVGKWRYQSSFGAEGFELYPEGVFRKGYLNGAAKTSWEGNKLTVSALFNDRAKVFDPACELEFEHCSQGFKREYLVVAKHNDKLYAIERKEKPNTFSHHKNDVEGLRVITLDKQASVSEIEPHVLWSPSFKGHKDFGADYMRLYERTDRGLQLWHLYHSELNGLQIGTGTYPHQQAQLLGGKLKYNRHGADYILEVVRSDAETMTFCEYLDGSTCAEGTLREMQYDIPVYTVEVEATTGGSIELNALHSYLLFGQPLEVTVKHDWGMYLESIEGCGISHSSTHSDTHLVFANTQLSQSCAIKAKFTNVPELMSEKLGISEPYLKACVDSYDVHRNLEYSESLSCSGGEIRSLTDLSELVKFKKLERLSLSGIDSLSDLAQEQLNGMSNLTSLSLADMTQSNLDLSKLTELKSLTLKVTDLTEVTLPQGGQLTSLNISVSGPEHLDLTGQTNLSSLDISYSTIKSVDLGQSNQLETLRAINAPLASITGISQSNRIKTLGLKNTLIEEVDFSQFTLLETLEVEGTTIRSLDLSSLANLSKLNAQNTPLENLAVNKNRMRILALSNTQLTELDLTDMIELVMVHAADSKIAHLRLGNNPKLSLLRVQNNLLKALQIPEDSTLRTLDVSGNSLEALGVTQNHTIANLRLSDNHVSTFDIGKFSRLRVLNLSNNPLVELSKPDQHLMAMLFVDNTLLKEFDLSTYTGLKQLSISGTAINSIEILNTFEVLRVNNTAIKALNLPQGIGNLQIEFRGNTLDEVTGGASVRNVKIYLGDTTVSDKAMSHLQRHYGRIFALVCKEGKLGDFCTAINRI
ncbi:hypothetical protein J8M20_01625 [Pseudoalteromonas luteoviolacea]|uniref:PKD domain-containing protein n=1 Tax=Pseudoalteromonas luteoviolacea TaxID=43657 RepID=UPI001B36C695|nr:hypothetical protein [Pseudoalteromonas luteoviolacea]